MQKNRLLGHISWRFWLVTASTCLAAGLVCLADFQESRFLDPLKVPYSELVNAMLNYPAWITTHLPGWPRMWLWRIGWLHIDSDDVLFLVGVVLLWSWVGRRLAVLFRQEPEASSSISEPARLVVNFLGLCGWLLAAFDASENLHRAWQTPSLSLSLEVVGLLWTALLVAYCSRTLWRLRRSVRVLLGKRTRD